MGAPSLKLGSLSAIADKEDEGLWVDIKHPSGDPLCMGGQKEPFRVRVAGAYSSTARTVTKRHRDELWKRGGRIDGDDIERRALGTLVACTLEWENAFDDDGKPIPFSKENVRFLYGEAPFIAEQLDAAMGDHSRFFTSASETP